MTRRGGADRRRLFIVIARSAATKRSRTRLQVTGYRLQEKTKNIFCYLLPVTCYLLLAGCGYTIGSTWPDARTIEVPVFRRAIVSGWAIEFELTKAVQDEITSRGNMKIVRGGGDLKLEGEIVEYNERVVTEAAAGVSQEERVLTLAVDLVLIDRRKSTQVKRTVSEEEPFSVIRGENEASAREKAIREIARKIYFQFEEW